MGQVYQRINPLFPALRSGPTAGSGASLQKQIPSSDLERAIEIAVTAHRGQVDKSGAPYILHPLRVMLSLKTEEERIVAVLHDVVEDCEEWPLERLRGEGLPERLATALESVTRNDGETYTEFIERSKTNAIGRRVKTADLRDNMDL